MSNLGLKKYITLVMHSPDEIELRSGIWNTTSFSLKDSNNKGILSQVANLLDGNLSGSEIAQNLQASRTDVEDIISHLDQLGVLEDAPTTALDFYLDNMVPTLIGTQSPDKRKIILLGSSELTGSIQQILSESESDIEISGIMTIPSQIYESGGQWKYDGLQYTSLLETVKDLVGSSLVICAFSSIDILAFEFINRASLDYKFPWLHVAMDGPMIMIGPLFTPPKGPCYECFEKRVSMNLRNHSAYVSYKNALVARRIKNGRIPIDSILTNMVASHAVLEAMNFISTNSGFTFGKVMCLYLPTMEFSFNEVLRLPGCPACGTIAELDDTELYFDVRHLFNEDLQ